MKAFKCRGGKLTRIFCYILLSICLLIFGSLSFSWSSNFEQASALALAGETLVKKEALAEYNVGALATTYKVEPSPVIYTPYTPSNYISILGRTIEVVNTNTTNVTPDYQIARYINGAYRGKFYFGHNASYLFGGLAGVSIGSTFSIAIDGVVHYYRVAYIETVEKTSIMNGEMANIAMAKWRGQNYSVSLMTCAGQSYGNGDASHRTLMFANEI